MLTRTPECCKPRETTEGPPRHTQRRRIRSGCASGAPALRCVASTAPERSAERPCGQRCGEDDHGCDCGLDDQRVSKPRPGEHRSQEPHRPDDAEPDQCDEHAVGQPTVPEGAHMLGGSTRSPVVPSPRILLSHPKQRVDELADLGWGPPTGRFRHGRVPWGGLPRDGEGMSWWSGHVARWRSRRPRRLRGSRRPRRGRAARQLRGG